MTRGCIIRATQMILWDELKTGAPITELNKAPDHKQIFMFSAATWNRHLIHYDKDTATNEGHRDIVVQRGLFGNYLAQCLTDWVKDSGELKRLEWKVVGSAYPGDRLTCKGEIFEKSKIDNELILKCSVQIDKDLANTIVLGVATLKMFR